MIRTVLLRVPVIGKWVERRWMPNPVERDLHREVVRGRLDAPAPPPRAAAAAVVLETAEATEPAEPKLLTGGDSED